MFEIHPIHLILLTEGLIFSLVAFFSLLLFVLIGRRKRRQALDKLFVQFKSNKAARLQSTESFLKDVMQLEGDALSDKLETISRLETEHYQSLIDALRDRGELQLSRLSSSLTEMLEIYKAARPLAEPAPVNEPLLQQVNQLKDENKQLAEALSSSTNKMGRMISEFGEIFGGGQQHELTPEEIMVQISVEHSDIEIKSEVEHSEVEIEIDQALTELEVQK